jgi:hypothetical protein
MPEKTGEKQVERPAGRFRPGQSGNPRGRPVGSRSKTSAMCQEMLDGDAAAVIRSLVKRAKRGNAIALRLVVERLLPRVKSESSVHFEIPELAKAGDIVAGWGAIIAAAAEGLLSLEEAAKFGQILEGQRKALETAELEVRIAALEVVE